MEMEKKYVNKTHATKKKKTIGKKENDEEETYTYKYRHN